MKTAPVAVTSKGAGISEALAVTEKLGQQAGLERKPCLHLRLLAEELFGLLRGIAGDVEANYWIEAEGKSFELHMQSEVNMTDEMREQFISASSDKKNYAAGSFMGKIRVMIADALLSAKEALPYAMINTASAYSPVNIAGETGSFWSMSAYKDEIQRRMDESKEASEAWDELEKSIVANIADDVKVKIVGKNAEIIVYKAF